MCRCVERVRNSARAGWMLARSVRRGESRWSDCFVDWYALFAGHSLFFTGLGLNTFHDSRIGLGADGHLTSFFLCVNVDRFYDPYGGRILLGGRDLSTYNPADISNVVSWVTQEPQLFPISGNPRACYRALSSNVGVPRYV